MGNYALEYKDAFGSWRIPIQASNLGVALERAKFYCRENGVLVAHLFTPTGRVFLV